MKKDLERLMRDEGIDVLWVLGASSACPDIYYLTGGVPLTTAWVILRPGKKPLLCHSPLEREAARSSGCRTLDFGRLGASELSRRYSDPVEVRFRMFKRLAGMEKLSGRLAVHGVMDPVEAHALLSALSRRLPGIRIARVNPTVLERARLTKDRQEISRMKRVAVSALEALEAGLQVIRDSRAEGDRVVDRRGRPLSVGMVKEAISMALAERGLYEAHGTIFSIGREAGIPHAESPPATVLTTGRTVVLDLFPRQTGGGYFFDITRSFCIGHAPPEARKLYREVLAAQRKAIAAAGAGIDGSRLQELVCDHFEALGHPTLRSRPGTAEGYVHNLGHGVGVEVHEYPYLRLQDKPDECNRLRPGTVFTVEPGLYYPERGMGVRLEDVVYLDSRGKARVLAPFKKFPVLGLKN
ncbi:MAG: aminopeptidase P family protein [Candidatus Glassbacteria bacterium]|nr:aminopeptidase P family protein [Candidatus Glassbacteria bacterium]